MRRLSSLIDFVMTDVAKLLRFAAVSLVTVPVGLSLFWVLLQTNLDPVVANIIAVTISTLPNYWLNRYWVWNKQGKNSMRREIAPFWAMAFFGLIFSTVLVWFAGLFTDRSIIFLLANFMSFGLVWIFKFVVLERFLFGTSAVAVREPVA